MQLSHTLKSEDVSIYTAVYNHEATIADTIESVLMQKTRHSFHMYCFNDASTDESGRILEDYRARHPDKLTVFTSTKNQGSGKNHSCTTSRRTRAASGVFLQRRLLDVGRQTGATGGASDRNPRATGCSTYTVMRNEMTGDETIIAPQLDHWNLMDMLVNNHALYVHPSSILWRNVHVKSGCFLPPAYVRSELSGDTLLLHMMLFRGGEIVNLPEVTSCYRVTGRGVWSRLSQMEMDAKNFDMHQYIRSQLPLEVPLGPHTARGLTGLGHMRIDGLCHDR